MPASAPTPTILVVDDDEGLLVLMEGALRSERWKVATAASGADALAWLRGNAAELLLLDLKLHDVEGPEFLGAMSDAGRSIPFIVITGQGDERVAVEMMKRGALDYLVKDANFVEFLPTLVRRAFALIDQQRQLRAAQHSVREGEEALKVSDDRYRTLFNTLIEGFCIVEMVFDDHDRPVDYRFLEVNPAFEKQSGLQAAEGRLIRDLVPGLEPHWFETFGRIALTGEPARFVNEARALHRWYEVSAFRFGGAESRKVAILLNDITERRRLESELLEIADREQQRIGHDLHDGLGQRLTGLEMLSHALAEDLNGRAPALAKQARRLNRELRETVTQARLISHSLAPVPLEGDGLMQGLSELAAGTNRIPGVACRFTCDPPVCIPAATTATHLYRIAQEAVNNALKHGKARTIDIALTERAEAVELSVENDGRRMAAAKRPHRGMGLNVMRYRAEMIGASLTIDSGKRRGVRVRCTLRRKT